MTGLDACPDAVRALARTLAAGAAAAGHRRLLVLSGERQWGCHLAGELLHDQAAGSVIWVGRNAPETVRSQRGRDVLRLLGTEIDLLVVDAWSGFDPDAFGAATGMVVAGGLIVLVVPPMEDWPAWPDPELDRISMDGASPHEIGNRFVQRLVRVIEDDRDVVLVKQGRPLPAVTVTEAPAVVPTGASGVCRTPDQARAVEAVLRVARGRRRRPLVLSADRGRGKSAALGIAVSRLADESGVNVIVTAPERAAVETVFQHARQVPGLRFLTPDQILAERPRAQLLLVDEAAGLPVHTLETLVSAYSRVVFSTTIHGYEGTGRGFALRFRDRLDVMAPGWKALHLDTPIRWAPADPVERFTFRALLLDAAMPRMRVDPAEQRISVERLDRDGFLNAPERLEQLFGLLVQAHYRTRPLDLRNLLDGPRLSVHAACADGVVLGAALAVREGGFQPATADAIWAGLRRPHGHLLPQSLAAHVGVRGAPRESMLRVMRIAVHPDCQRRGTGRALLDAVVAQAREQGLGLVGTSFGATPALLDFWGHCGFRAVRVGTRRDAASGTYSVLMIRALNPTGRQLLGEASARFAESLPVQLTDPLNRLEPMLVESLMASVPAAGTPSAACWADAATFAWGRREFNVCLPALRTIVWWGVTVARARTALTPVDKEALIRRVLQGQAWTTVADSTGVSGRSGVIQILRRAVDTLIRTGAPPSVSALRFVGPGSG